MNKITKWGNSLGVRIPNAVAKQAGLAAGVAVNLTVQSGRVVVEPVEYDLNTLLSGITAKNVHAAVDTGKAVGAEVW